MTGCVCGAGRSDGRCIHPIRVKFVLVFELEAGVAGEFVWPAALGFFLCPAGYLKLLAFRQNVGREEVVEIATCFLEGEDGGVRYEEDD